MGVRVKLNIPGFVALRTSPAMVADLKARADRIAAAAGPGHGVSAEAGRRRALAMVWTETSAARRGEAVGRALTRAVGAGR